MSKKMTRRRKPPQQSVWRKPWTAAVVIGILCAVATAAAAYRWEPLRRAIGLPASVAPAAQQPAGSLPLAKEYVYAGGKLIATDEPAAAPTPSPTPNGSAPTGLNALATSGGGVLLTWAAPAAGTVSYYSVERRQRDGVTELTVNQTSPSFTDTTAQADMVYRYRVRAVFSGGVFSDYSNGDLATTFFQNEPINPGQSSIRAKHLNDLQRAVNDVRVIAGLGEFTWTQPSPAAGVPIRAAYVEELRSNLDPALAALGLPVTAYPTDPSPPSLSGKGVKAAHVNELLERIR